MQCRRPIGRRAIPARKASRVASRRRHAGSGTTAVAALPNAVPVRARCRGCARTVWMGSRAGRRPIVGTRHEPRCGCGRGSPCSQRQGWRRCALGRSWPLGFASVWWPLRAGHITRQPREVSQEALPTLTAARTAAARAFCRTTPARRSDRAPPGPGSARPAACAASSGNRACRSARATAGPAPGAGGPGRSDAYRAVGGLAHFGRILEDRCAAAPHRGAPTRPGGMAPHRLPLRMKHRQRSAAAQQARGPSPRVADSGAV